MLLAGVRAWMLPKPWPYRCGSAIECLRESCVQNARCHQLETVHVCLKGMMRRWSIAFFNCESE